MVLVQAKASWLHHIRAGGRVVGTCVGQRDHTVRSEAREQKSKSEREQGSEFPFITALSKALARISQELYQFLPRAMSSVASTTCLLWFPLPLNIITLH